MTRKPVSASPPRPAGLQSITPHLYAQLRRTIRMLSAAPAPAR